MAFDDLGPAEQVTLVEVKAEFLARLELAARLDLGRDHLHAERGAVPERIGQGRRCHRQDVELDDRCQLEERVVVLAQPVVVEGEGVALLCQPPATFQHLRAPGYVFADLDHRLGRRQHELLLSDQERPGGVHEGQLVAYRARRGRHRGWSARGHRRSSSRRPAFGSPGPGRAAHSRGPAIWRRRSADAPP